LWKHFSGVNTTPGFLKTFSKFPLSFPILEFLAPCWRVGDDTRRFLVRGEWPAHWEPQEEGMMSIAVDFPSVKKPRFYRSGEKRQCDWRWCLLVCDSFGQFIYGVLSKLCLLAATQNLHTTQPSTLFPTCDEVVNLTGLLETKVMSVSTGKQ
jgi:hypothetical protein